LRKRLAFFFLTSSLILILGHSMLPHNHVGEDNRCKISDVKKTTLAEIIRFTLSHDLGANHLEEYNDCKQVELISVDFERFLPIVESIKFLAGYFLSINENTVANNSQVSPQNYCPDTGLRGPPKRS